MPEGDGTMLKQRLKECAILLTFVFFLQEVLIMPTIGFALLGTILVLLKIRPGSMVRNIMALTVLVAYWFNYGLMIDPEVGINFLTTIIVLKLLESEGLRDRYMIFFGLLLLISSGSLFERTISYTLFFTFSFFILIRNFYTQLQLEWDYREIGRTVLWVLPVTVLLFFMIPRVMSPIPFQKSAPADDEVGYNPSVSPAQVEKLKRSNRLAFRAMVDSAVSQKNLYWRGNSLSSTDGWNWTFQHSDRLQPLWQPAENRQLPNGIRQTIRLESKEDFFFALDHPRVFISSAGIHHSESKSLAQHSWQWIQNYEVISSINAVDIEEDDRRYLSSPLTQSRKDWIERTFPGEKAEDVIAALQVYFQQKGFTYSLEPGRILSFEEFMRKKIGFCSHFASASALILRAKKIPVRLVSGFMGGEYNRFGNLYLVSQNDAHAWIEVKQQGRWQRYDPTEWIAPERMQLGGEAYMDTLNSQNTVLSSLLKRQLAWVQDVQKWFNHWDFMFYQWLEQVDYHGQQAWLQKLKLKRGWLYLLIPLILLGFFIIYRWYIQRHVRVLLSPEQQLWNDFLNRAHLRGLALPEDSLASMRNSIHSSNHPLKQEFIQAFDQLVALSYARVKAETIGDYKRLIKRL
jgi:protein-glutamine gamma-glutamyltransferase